jgi:hypothetical protein
MGMVRIFAFVTIATCLVVLALPIDASYARDVWKPELPAIQISEQLNGVACNFFGMGSDCNVAGVKEAFEQSSYERVIPRPALFEDWYTKYARPALDSINAPVRNLRLEVEAALRNPSKAFEPDGDVHAEKETSLQRQYCESQGGSKLYCQKSNPLPWDASSDSLKSRLVCAGNSSVPLDFYSVPVSTQEAAVLYLPYIDQELDDVMLIANISRALLPVFQKNHRTVNTVRFQRFVAVDGIALVYPAVAARHIRRAYKGADDLNDLRESPSFTHSSCTRQVVFVLDVSSKSAYFDLHHRSEAMIFRIFRLLNAYDQVQLMFVSSSAQTFELGSGMEFVAAGEDSYAALQTKLSHVLRSGFVSLDSGVSLAQDLLRVPAAQHSSCVKKFLILLSSDEASLLPSTIDRHVSLENSRDEAGNALQPYFIFFSMDSEGQGDLAGTFCRKKMIHRSIPRMQSSTYRGLDNLNRITDDNGFFSDAAFGVMRYCTFLFELLAVNAPDGPSGADDMRKVVWSPPFYDAAAAPGSLIFTTSAPVFSISAGISRFRGVVEVDHVFFTYPSASNQHVSRSDGSVVSILNRLPAFLGARVDVALTALGVGMSFVDAAFMMKLNSLALPLQPQFSGIICGQLNESSKIFSDLNSYRSSVTFASSMQWSEANAVDQSTFVNQVMKSPQVYGNVPVTSVGSGGQTLFFRHSESATLVFLRKFPLFSGQMALLTETSFSKNCSANAAACRSQTDGLLFMSNASTQAGFVLATRAFQCPLCARDAALSRVRDAIFNDLGQFILGKSGALFESDFSMLPSAIAELNILASLRKNLEQASSSRIDIFAASVSGVNGVTLVVNRVMDLSLKSTAFNDYSHDDWFLDAALRPGVMHVSLDPASDSSQPATFLLIVSIGIVVQSQGTQFNSGDFPAKGLAAVAHLRVRATWLISVLSSALLLHDPRHICMSSSGVCAIINSRGFVVASTASNRIIYMHVQTMYPHLAQALLDHKVFVREWRNRFGLTVNSDLHVRVDSGITSTWSLNVTGSSKFRMFFADSLYSIRIAALAGVAGVLLTAYPHYSLDSNVRDLELPLLLDMIAPDPIHGPSLSPRIIPNMAEIDNHTAALSAVLQEKSCEQGDPSWLIGVSIGVGVGVLFLITIVTLHRFRLFQRLMAYLFRRKSSIALAVRNPTTELDRYQFKLCSPNDFPVQNSILRCVSVFQKAISILETQIVAFNTFSLSNRIIADDIDGQRIKIQNYLEVLKKQRTLLHERIVSRM